MLSPRSSASTITRSSRRGLQGDPQCPVNCHRQAEAVVVVGVLANQIDAAGARTTNAGGSLNRSPKARITRSIMVDFFIGICGCFFQQALPILLKKEHNRTYRSIFTSMMN